jgi:hypothetical protein
MIKAISKHQPAIGLISVICMLFASADLRADESLSNDVAEGTKSFLSDPARAGSLVGTIIAGAAIANPLAPILGSLTGFFIGKNTNYTNNNKVQQGTGANRSLIPDNDRQIASLSGLTGEQRSIIALNEEPKTAEASTIIKMAKEPAVVAQPQAVEQSNNLGLGLHRKTEDEDSLQRQLSFTCSHVQVTQQVPIYCYYYSE